MPLIEDNLSYYLIFGYYIRTYNFRISQTEKVKNIDPSYAQAIEIFNLFFKNGPL